MSAVADPLPAVGSARAGRRALPGQGDSPLGALSATAVRWSAMGALALPTIEGYLLEIHPLAAKAPAAAFIMIFALDRVVIRPRRPAFHPVQAALLVLLGVVVVSALANADGANTLAYVLRWVPFLLLTVALVDAIARDLPPLWAVMAILTTTTIAAAGALGSVALSGNPRATGPLEDPNDLAYVLVSAVPLALLLPGMIARKVKVGRSVRVAAPRWAEVASTLVSALLVAGAAATFSRGGAVGLSLALGLLMVRGVLPWRRVAALVLVGVAGAVILLATIGPILERALQEKLFIAGNNIETRELRWAAAVEMLGDKPVFGVGPGNFQQNYVQYGGNAELSDPNPVAHTMYLEVGAELGFTGLLAFVAVLGFALFAAEDLSRAGPPKTRLLGHALQASLVAALVASVFLSEQYYMTLWALVAVSCAAAMRNRALSSDS